MNCLLGEREIKISFGDIRTEIVQWYGRRCERLSEENDSGWQGSCIASGWSSFYRLMTRENVCVAEDYSFFS